MFKQFNKSHAPPVPSFRGNAKSSQIKLSQLLREGRAEERESSTTRKIRPFNDQDSLFPTTELVFGYENSSTKNKEYRSARFANPKTGEIHKQELMVPLPKHLSRAKAEYKKVDFEPARSFQLGNVLRSAKRSLEQLKMVKERLSTLTSQDEQLVQGQKKTNPGADFILLSKLAESIALLTQDAFVPAHRLNQTALGLISVEDLLRHPKDLSVYDFSNNGRIKIPTIPFNQETITKARECVDRATDVYNKSEGRGLLAKEMQDILLVLLRSLQDFYVSCLGCAEVFKLFLYLDESGKSQLQRFILSLSSIDRSDMLTEIQSLRRTLDEVVIFLEKLTWASYVVFRLASGLSVNPSPELSVANTRAQTHVNPKLGKDLERKRSLKKTDVNAKARTSGSKTKLRNSETKGQTLVRKKSSTSSKKPVRKTKSNVSSNIKK